MCIISPFKFYKAPIIGFRLFAKTLHKSSNMFTQQACEVVMERESEGVVHFDGEPSKMGKTLNISLVNKGLNIFIP